MNYYEKLTQDELSHVQAQFLAIEEINRQIIVWSKFFTLDRLRDNKSRNIINVLQMSYDDSGEKDWK